MAAKSEGELGPRSINWVKNRYNWPFAPDKKKPVVITKDLQLPGVYWEPKGAFPPHYTRLLASTDKISVGIFTLTPGMYMSRPDFHEGDEVYYILKGTLTVEIDEQECFDVNEGEAFLIPAGRKHRDFNFTEQMMIGVWAIAPKF